MVRIIPLLALHSINDPLSLWHELRVVLHNRENALLSEAVKNFARHEHEYAENVANNWESLSDAVEGMPFE